MTLLEAVRSSPAHAAPYNPGDVAAPAAVPWTDADRRRRPVVRQSPVLMRELLKPGGYDPAAGTGPAIRPRCAIEPGAYRAENQPTLT
ncbi:MAG: hypothetical protein GYA33_11470 [Thermogutta sp.]|nr:hypothetical protein [Thermogutta sp.]